MIVVDFSCHPGKINHDHETRPASQLIYLDIELFSSG
jgi:hypothetical protein